MHCENDIKVRLADTRGRKGRKKRRRANDNNPSPARSSEATAEDSGLHLVPALVHRAQERHGGSVAPCALAQKTAEELGGRPRRGK